MATTVGSSTSEVDTGMLGGTEIVSLDGKSISVLDSTCTVVLLCKLPSTSTVDTSKDEGVAIGNNVVVDIIKVVMNTSVGKGVSIGKVEDAFELCAATTVESFTSAVDETNIELGKISSATVVMALSIKLDSYSINTATVDVVS